MKSATNDTQTLLHGIFGFQISQAIFVASKLNIAEQLATGPMSCQELADMVEVRSDALYRLLRALASMGIFEETESGFFSNTRRSELLMADHEQSMKITSLMYGEEQYRAWGDLSFSVKTGENAFSHIYKEEFFPYLQQHANALDIFNQYLDKNAVARVMAVLNAYDFSTTHRILDVGGGHGHLLIELLRQYSHIEGMVFDTKEVIESALKSHDCTSSQSLVTYQAGDFFAGIPLGFDVHFLSYIIHDWDDASAIRLLKNCRQSLADSGTLILVESIIKPGNTFDSNKWMDLHMLVTTNGKERTEAEYKSLLHHAGFELTRCIVTAIGSYIIEATPAPFIRAYTTDNN